MGESPGIRLAPLERYERQMKKGIVEILVLRMLLTGECYGYQLLCRLREEGGELFHLKEGTLYPILYRLEEDGLVQSQWREAGDTGKSLPKKYYTITPLGEETLVWAYGLWKRMSQKVDGILSGEGRSGS